MSLCKHYFILGQPPRVIALIVDVIILGIATLIIGLPLAFVLVPSTVTGYEEVSEFLRPLTQLLLSSLIWLYFTLSESSRWQATLGKKMFGFRVTDKEGNKIGFGRANARYWSKFILAPIFYVGFIMVAFTKRKQGLHDFIAGTLVMKTKLKGKELEQLKQEENKNDTFLVKKGQELYRSGNYQEANALLTNAITLNHNHTLAHYTRALVNNKLGNRTQVLTDLKNAAKLGHNKAQEFLKSKGIEW